MADKSFMTRKGGTIGELRTAATVATTDAISNAAGAGRGAVNSFADLVVNQAGAGRGLINPAFAIPGSPFAHLTDNVVVNGKSADSDAINLNTAFRPNILDNYDVVTYHWKFFMVTNDAASTGAIFSDDVQTIIAESGVSDLTIDKVEIRSITTPSVESGTGTSTNVKFEIVEPAGAGLIDKIFYQSLALGIGNWNVMPFYLQLQFRGRSPTTSEADDGSPGSVGSLRWVYPVKITSIKANVTTVGTRYEFECIIYNEYAQSNTVFSLQHPVVLNDLSTFTDAMAKLQYQLNDDQFYRLIDNNSIPDSYRIIVDPVLTTADYNITPADSNTNSRRNDSTVEFDGKNATFVPGTSIDKIIDTLLSQTNGFQKSMLNAQVPGADGQTMSSEVNQMKNFWRIITETRPLKFDPRRNDYAREYSIYVVQYDIGILDQNTFQDTAPPTTLVDERKRLMTYVKKSILRKKYNYIFTGLNDQILNFDIKINNAFAVATARMGGIYFNAAMADKGVVTHDHSVDEAYVTSKIQRAISLQNTASKATQVEANNAIDEANSAIDKANLPDIEKIRLIKLLQQSKPESRLNYVNELQTAGGLTNTFNLAKANAAGAIGNIGGGLSSIGGIGSIGGTISSVAGGLTNSITNSISSVESNVLGNLGGLTSKLNLSTALNAAQLIAKGTATPRDQKVTQQNKNFISDVDIRSPAAQKAYTDYVNGIKGKLRPVARVDSMQQRQVGLGVESNSNSGIQKLSSMFSVALHSSYDTSFAQITLSIKGDPFWLFPQPYTDVSARIYNSLKPDADAIAQIKRGHFTAVDSANIYGTDNFILIRFRTPRTFTLENNPDSSNPNADVETFSGVFKVVSIINKFESGKFHQELTCIMDYNINILNFMAEIEGNAQTKDTPATAGGLTLKSLIPATAISAQRILGDSGIKGIQDSISSAASSFGSLPSISSLSSIASIGTNLASNIPTSIPSVLSGLPNKFFG